MHFCSFSFLPWAFGCNSWAWRRCGTTKRGDSCVLPVWCAMLGHSCSSSVLKTRLDYLRLCWTCYDLANYGIFWASRAVSSLGNLLSVQSIFRQFGGGIFPQSMRFNGRTNRLVFKRPNKSFSYLHVLPSVLYTPQHMDSHRYE